MISRKSAVALARVYVRLFRKSTTPGRSSYRGVRYYTVNSGILYDFLFANDYDAWFCNLIRKAKQVASTRPLQDFIMKLHTGESISTATQSWSWDERQSLGQRYLRDLAQDVITYIQTELEDYFKNDVEDLLQLLLRQLELDGYVLIDSKLLSPEEEIINVEEEVNLLKSLYTSLGLDNSKVAFHHLDLSEEHYIAEKWDDSISNSRKFLESVLQEVSAARFLSEKGSPMPESRLNKPVDVREYLERAGLLEKKEKDAVAKVYGLLSHTGGHPYMAENDQARLLRHLSLTLSQFALLRYRGYTQAA